jgi:tetratricopeptide (TPR) repeat protein
VLTFSAEPIEFPITPAAPDIVTPPWVTEELKLMGWKPLKSIDFFGEKLLPPEYSEAVDRFNDGNVNEARDLLYRRWTIEKSLPQPFLVYGILCEKAGQREEALKWIKRAANEGAKEPSTLAEIARWEFSVGMRGRARKHAEAALQLWPDHSIAKNVLKNLDKAGSTSNSSAGGLGAELNDLTLGDKANV